MNESVDSDAFVMPRSSGRPLAGSPPPPSPDELDAQREMDDYSDLDFSIKDEGE